MSSYPTAACRKSRNAGDELWEMLFRYVGHSAERQQLVNDDKTTVEKFGLDAVAVIVQEPRVLYLHPSQVALNH